jgi:hypothetical protein
MMELLLMDFSQDSASLDDANQDDDHGDHEEDVNEPSHGVGGH